MTLNRRILYYALLIFLILSGVLFSYNQANDSENNGVASAVSTQNWHNVIRQYRESMNVVSKNASVFRITIKQMEADNGAYVQSVEQRISALDFLLQYRERINVFEISLRCKQVSDLCNEFGVRIGKERALLAYYVENAERLKMLQEKIVNINLEKLSLADIKERELTLKEGSELQHLLKSAIAKTTILLQYADEVQLRLDKLNNDADLRRSELVEKVFFTPQGSLWQSYLHSGMILKVWFSDVSSWLTAQFPNGREFWLNFLILGTLILLPLMIFWKRVFFPFLIRQTFFPDKYLKSKLFTLAFFLIALAILLSLAQNWLNASEITIFEQLSKMCFSLAMLLCALGVRMDRAQMLGCLRMYTPTILQNILLLICLSCLITFRAMLIVLPIFNVVTAVWTLLWLNKKEIPKLDQTIGVFTILLNVGSTILVFNGLPYVGFTMIMIWLTLVAETLIVVATTEIVINVLQHHPERRLLNNLLKKALLPGLYSYVFFSMIKLISSTYYLDDWVVELSSTPLPFPEEIMTLSASGMVKLVIAGVALHALISSFKILLHQSLGERAESGLAASFMTLGTYVIWFMFVLVLLFLLRVHYSSVLVILGGLSMGIGFAFKEVLENFISGVIILIGQQVRPGDMIEFDGILAKVTKVSIRATVVESDDGAILTFPNSQILTKNFRNWTSNNNYLRRDIAVGVSYGSDVAEVKRLLLEAAKIVPVPRRFPLPLVIFDNFGGSSLDFILRLWLPAAKYIDFSTAVRERICELFAEHNINIPFPQLDVHFDAPLKKAENSPEVKPEIVEANLSTEQ